MFRVRSNLLVLFALITLIALNLPSQPTVAQETEATCAALVEHVLSSVQEACRDLGTNEACYGSAPVTIAVTEDATGDFEANGDIIDLANIEAITTGSIDLANDDWGIVIFNTQADLPPESESSLTLALFGEAEITSVVDASTAPPPTLALQNTAGYPVNLRAGAGTTFATVGTLDEDLEVITDGRNANGDWFRIHIDTGPAWVYTDLVTVDGDPSTLDMLADDNISMGFTQPMQAFTLIAAAEDLVCGNGSAGLLAQLSGENAAHIQINGAGLAFSTATFLVQATPGQQMQIIVLDGSVSVSAQDTAVTIEAGASLQVALGGEDGLTAVAGPDAHETYSFAAVDGAPVTLMPEEMACVIGLEAGYDPEMLRFGPGEDYDQVVDFDTNAPHTVIGQVENAAGTSWWQLDTGFTQTWVVQDNVQTLGACRQVAQVNAPSPSTVSNPMDENASSVSFVPPGQTVWQAESGLDNVSGTCSGPPIAMCAHLAAITNNPDGSIDWRGQEPLPYTMSMIAPNTFYYSGRNSLSNGNVTMTLSFDNESAWSMTMTTIYDNDPACEHTFYYTATRSW